MSIIKKRVTLLFQSPEDIADSVQRNETHLIIKNRNEVLIQTRWQIINDRIDENNTNGLIRITWKDRKYSTNDYDNNTGSFINTINGIINTGFNVYLNDSTVTHLNGYPLIKTPKYNLLHCNKPLLDIFANIFSADESSLIGFNDFNPSNQFDILKDSNITEINKYEILEPNSLFLIGEEKNNNNNNNTLSNTVSNLEVGLFYIDFFDKSDINLSGLRCLWNQTNMIETCLKTSLFYKPLVTRTNNTPSLQIQLEEPIGLHPKILVNLSNYETETNCQYFLFSQLPLELFMDKFQSDPVFLFGEHDLELPEYKLTERSWGSEFLYLLEPGQINELTLHSRYLNISTPNPSIFNVTFDPVVFKACDKNPLDIVKNPFYSKSLGLESFFTDDTNFNILNSTSLIVPIPRPGYKDYNKIQFFTGLTLLLSIMYLIWKVIPKRASTEKRKNE